MQAVYAPAILMSHPPTSRSSLLAFDCSILEYSHSVKYLADLARRSHGTWGENFESDEDKHT